MVREREIEQAEKRLDEQEQRIERAGQEAEHALKELRTKGSAPETLQTSESPDEEP